MMNHLEYEVPAGRISLSDNLDYVVLCWRIFFLQKKEFLHKNILIHIHHCLFGLL